MILDLMLGMSSFWRREHLKSSTNFGDNGEYKLKERRKREVKVAAIDKLVPPCVEMQPRYRHHNKNERAA